LNKLDILVLHRSCFG